MDEAPELCCPGERDCRAVACGKPNPRRTAILPADLDGLLITWTRVPNVAGVARVVGIGSMAALWHRLVVYGTCSQWWARTEGGFRSPQLPRSALECSLLLV